MRGLCFSIIWPKMVSIPSGKFEISLFFFLLNPSEGIRAAFVNPVLFINHLEK